MSIRMLTVSLPAAFLALGVVALSTSASHATDNARDDYASTAHYTAGYSFVNREVSKRKKKHHFTRRSSDRFSGFGFRGDGFRFSGKYN